MMILAPFSTNFDLNAALRELDVSGGLNTKALSAATNLANRLGRALDPEFTQSALPDPLRVKDLTSSGAAPSISRQTNKQNDPLR